MRSILALGLLAFAVKLAAQGPIQMTVQKTVTGPNGTKTTAQVVQVTPRCPVDMRLRQGGGMQMLRADDGTTKPLMTPSLTLSPWDRRTVVAATVTVHGAAPHARVLPLVAQYSDGKKDPSQLTKTMALNLQVNDSGETSAEMSLPGWVLVNTVELNSLTYADGTTWKVAKDSGCSVAPDPLLLIAAH